MNDGHEAHHVIQFLNKSHAEGKLVHAYLFFGGDNIEKRHVAKKFAKLILEADQTAAHLIDTDAHANVMVISPDGKNIKKEQIVFLKADIGKKAIENKAKIYIIEEADKLSISAMNSLLKFLEEPASDVHIILIAPTKEALLPTLVSRTVNLNFSGLKKEKGVIEAAFLDVIHAFEAGELPQLVVAKHAVLLKAEPLAFFEAYQMYLRGVIDDVLLSQDRQQLKKCVGKLRALEEAKGYLKYNMNVSLCLDQLGIKLNS
ncbi:MAG: hypothetical protein FWG67_02845 [Defluviitaleaceae bacterium]|nr:hypothetical protein [Defluviitaleaceae bacterium]